MIWAILTTHGPNLAAKPFHMIDMNMMSPPIIKHTAGTYPGQNFLCARAQDGLDGLILQVSRY